LAWLNSASVIGGALGLMFWCMGSEASGEAAPWYFASGAEVEVAAVSAQACITEKGRAASNTLLGSQDKRGVFMVRAPA
jgi:hypothetical protein